MLFRTLGQEVYHPAPSIINPIDRSLTIYESKYFYPRQQVLARRPIANHPHSVELTFRHSCRCHLYTVYPQFFEQQTRYHQFFMRHERHSAGLFTVAECCIHDFYSRILVHLYSVSYWLFDNPIGYARKPLSYPYSVQGSRYRPGRSSSNVSYKR